MAKHPRRKGTRRPQTRASAGRGARTRAPRGAGDRFNARQQLLAKLMREQEAERSRLARELHDETAQVLTFLFVGLRLLADAPTLEEAREKARELEGLAERAIAQVRGLIRSLRPTILDDLGLEAELTLCAAEYRQAHGITVDLQVTGLEGRRLPPDIETALYRIAQEALTNTARHATAQHVSLVLQRADSAVQLIVEDDGRGFRVEAPGTEGTRQLGLLGMRERVMLLNGRLDIDSAPGRGTSVRARIPIPTGSR